MNGIQIFFITILSLCIIALSIVSSCQRSEIEKKDAELEEARSELERVSDEMHRIRDEIEEANRRIDNAIKNYKERNDESRSKHESRSEEIISLERSESEEVQNWMHQSVPDDVRMLLCLPGEQRDDSDADTVYSSDSM